MAHFAFIDGVATINAVNLSAHCVSINVPVSIRSVEDGPSMGQLDEKHLPVIRVTGPVRFRFKKDFASAQVHATLFPLWTNKTIFAYDAKPTSAADSAANPRVNGTGFISNMEDVVGGAFGEVSETEVTIMPAGTVPGLVEDVT